MGRGLVLQATGIAGGVTKLFSLCSALHRLPRKIPHAPREKQRVKKVPLLPFCPKWPRFVPFDPQKSFLSCVVAFLSCVVSF